MFRYLILSLLFFSIVSCSPYRRFDSFFSEADFKSAYQELQKINRTNSVQYQKRLYQTVTFLVLEGNTNFEQQLSILSKVPQSTNSVLMPYEYFARAFFYFKQSVVSKDYLSTLSYYTNLHSVPEEFKGYYFKQLGICDYKTGQFEQAVSNLSASLARMKMSDTSYFLSLSYIELNQLKKARSLLNKIILESGDSFLIAMASFQLGEISYDTSHYREAFQYYLDGLNRYPKTAYYTLKIAKCLKKLGYEESYPKFANIALRMQKDFADAWYFLNIN